MADTFSQIHIQIVFAVNGAMVRFQSNAISMEMIYNF
jgi:hypothetical protein